MRHKAYDVLDNSSDDCGIAAKEALRISGALALYVLHVGFMKLKSERRKKVKRELKRTPIKSSSSAKGHRLSDSFAKKYTKQQMDFMKRWLIEGIPLDKATKSILLADADKQEAAGKGHYQVAEFERAIARPMNDTETVPEHYINPNAIFKIRDRIWG